MEKEAYLELERRLVCYFQALAALPGCPLADVEIVPGHSDVDLDNISSWISVFARQSDVQMYSPGGGLENVELETMVATDADNVDKAVHGARVSFVRAAYSLQNLPKLKTWINQETGFALTGLIWGKPPVADGFDSEKRKRQGMFRNSAVCGLQ